MSEDKDRKWENDELDNDDDVEAHHKPGKLANDEPSEDDEHDVEAHHKPGKLANDEPKQDDDDNDVEAHFKASRL